MNNTSESDKTASIPLRIDDKKTSDEKCDNEKYSTTVTGICHQIFLTLIMSTMMTSVAMTLGFAAIFMSQVRNKTEILYMDEDMSSWYASINTLAALFGSLVAGFVMDRFGRRFTYFVPLIPTIVMWILTATAQSHFIAFTARFFIGFFGGFIPVTSQIYLAECVDPKLRSVTINVGYVSLSIGVLITYTLGSFYSWRSIAWACTFFPAITLCLLPFIHDTPTWLIRHGRFKEARASLMWLRGNEVAVEREIAVITRSYEDEKLLEQTKKTETDGSTSPWSECKQKFVYRPAIIVLLFILLFNVSGTYLILTYAVIIVEDLHLPSIDKSFATVLISIIRLVVTVIFCWLFLHVPRRKIYLIAGIGSALSTISLACYLIVAPDGISSLANTAIKGALLAAYIATNTGFQITPGFMIGELLPAKIRGKIGGYIYTMFSVYVFFLTKSFPFVKRYVGISGIFMQFGLASIAATLLVYFTVPETRNKPLNEIEEYFRHGSWIYQKRKRQIRDDIIS